MRKIYFFYPKGERLTGQEMASRIILDQLDKEWEFKLRTFPAFERREQNFLYPVKYIFRVLKLWAYIFSLIFTKSPVVYINLGQSMASLIRDGLPFVFLSFIRWDLHCVISLHGHVFTTWDENSKVQKLFRLVLKRAEIITVLGTVQKKCLISMGIVEHKVRIVNNTCELQPCESYKDVSETLNLLFLSNLIKSKGYLDYLNALKILSKKKDLAFGVDAVLCGQITISGTSEQDETLEGSEKEVLDLIAAINESPKVKVSWIRGAYGDEKKVLFEEADVLVFPSRYSVEAQPIVLLEAMATGTAIITSTVGEIPSTVSNKNAILLKSPDYEKIAESIISLTKDKLLLMKEEGLALFKKSFSHSTYRENWTEIFKKASGVVDPGAAPYCILSEFNNHDFNRGRPFFVELLWVCCRSVFFRFVYLPIYGIRRTLLRFFGGNIGANVIVKPTATITFPWRLAVGDNTWIGEEAWILNLEHVTLGSNVVISQKAFICTGNHNWSKPKFDLVVKPVVIENGVWVGAGVIVLPGVRIGANSIVTAGSVVVNDLPSGMICSGNPCLPVKVRKFDKAGNGKD
ncbi:MAG: WcaF family extracellular polysaccharide biosynthesis acetyltransferase [Lentisphaeraceae bacterium]|nr:WcaF family extracellular polysaccharide biosynthesis acetyltransferase [Lentisphaeraceae bacterium]